MSQNPAFDKLVRLLKELFQLDQPDLDFGLYRIMHARADEISQFLDRDLLPQVKEAFSQYRTADKAELEKELQQAIEQAHGLGVDPESTAKVKELRQKIVEQGVDVSGLEQEVYDHLFKFFRRYYHEGDFLAKRVYKPGVYAIPYEGEEVKLHWANKDQYYIKTSEYLRDYAFMLKPGADDPMRVHFRLADAAEGEHGNVKEADGNSRVFILASEDFIAEEHGESGKELVIRFEYRPATLDDWSEEDKADAKKKPPTQKDLRADAVRRILAVDGKSLKFWLAELAKTHIKADDEPADYSRLAAHLNRYTARNTFDYFIHKDLGGFLRREMDFYIKNEVMFLDDIESETAPRVEQYLSKIKVVRQIAGKIIDFLAQLEDFQKKIWLKKKFVTETFWCIRVSCIPEEFYTEIAANEAQWEEWVSLHAIDEIEGDLTTEAYSEPLTSDLMKSHPTLMVDTRHFDEGFTQRLLEAVGDIGGQSDGVLFNSENFQALRLCRKTYRNSIRCAYIDPPFNTGGDDFLYKDNYHHSSWLSSLQDRLIESWDLIEGGGSNFVHIDENELSNLTYLCDLIFGYENRINLISVKTKVAGVSGSHHGKSLKNATEYLVSHSKNKELFHLTGDIYDKEELWSYIEGLKEEGKSWKYTSILRNLDEGKHVKTIYDGSGNEIKVYTHEEYDFVPVNRVAAEEHAGNVKEAYYCNIDKVFRTTNAQSSVRQRVIDNCSDIDSNLISIRYVPRSGRNAGSETTIYYKDKARNMVTFLRDVVELIDGVPYKLENAGNFWPDIEYNNITKEGGVSFNNGKKPVQLIEKILRMTAGQEDVFLDYFAGSGSSGHAAINLNREDGGRRKFMLVEMGDYFDTVLLPRLKKVTFTPEWNAGKPKRLTTHQEAERSPRIMKVVRLESYEDALNNLESHRTETQGALLESAEAQGSDGLREQYLLRYMLDVETQGSQSVLNIDAFSDPTAYRLKVKRPGSEEIHEMCVDLLETFNWLVGLTIETMAAPQMVDAAFKREDDPDLPEENPRRLLLDGRLREDAGGPWWFRTVTGTTPDGRKTLVIWRKLTGDPEQDNLVLDEWFKKQGYSSKDSEFDLIYVNGDNNLENLRQPDDTWKVRLIEEDFHRLMFDESEE